MNWVPSEPLMGTGNMPTGLKNAHMSPEPVMRIGIPHKSGKLPFHAFNEGYPAMISASAFWNAKLGKFHIPDFCNAYELDFALDSAGYTAMKLWQSKGPQSGMAGVFPWTYEQYIELATSVGASWWSQPDLCCEPEIAKNQDEIDYRINATATLLEGVLRIIYAWQNELAKSCSANVVNNMLPPPVPVIQGRTVQDYLRSLELLQSVWERWEPWLAPPVLIGVGSVCRRDLHHPEHGLYAILSALEGKLPAGAKLHCFGIKGAALSELKMNESIASYDSMAYDLASRIKANKQGISNSMAHRSKEMTRWMTLAEGRIRPAVGDQFQFNFSS